MLAPRSGLAERAPAHRPHVRSDKRRERRLWHDPSLPSDSLGCTTCRERRLCGGLRTRGAFYDCLQYCCGSAADCDRVCRHNPHYADRVREVETFDLGMVRRQTPVPPPSLPPLVPVVYHRGRRRLPLASDFVALPLYRTFDRRTGDPRYATREDLRRAFGIESKSQVLLTGTDRDAPLERWWGLGEARRRSILRALRAAGVSLVTTPNYSLFVDRPRWDDMHAMKRIAIVHSEFLSEGLPAALHVNGRTDQDFHRWAEYVEARPEITHLAYEFSTGTGRPVRRKQHAAWLSELARSVNRPLHLITRGGCEVLPLLGSSFSGVTLFDTTIFMKTMMRQRAYVSAKGTLTWTRSPTSTREPLDDLFADNQATVEAWLGEHTASTATALGVHV